VHAHRRRHRRGSVLDLEQQAAADALDTHPDAGSRRLRRVLAMTPSPRRTP
jgi:hypothetical protein